MTDAPEGLTSSDQAVVNTQTGGFLSTRNGKMIVGGIALFLVVVAIGAIAFFFLLNGGTQPVVVVTPSPSAGGTPATEETQAASPSAPPEAPLDEAFTFRNIFAPSVSPPTTTSSSSSSSGSSSDSAPANTLVLVSISSESGEQVATFTWNGQEYQCKEGDQVGDSPWEVVSIDSDSVVMLYGDTKVTLTVGQGFNADELLTK